MSASSSMLYIVRYSGSISQTVRTACSSQRHTHVRSYQCDCATSQVRHYRQHVLVNCLQSHLTQESLLSCNNKSARVYMHTSSSGEGGLRHLFDARDKDHAEKEKQLVIHQDQYFDEAAKKARDKQTFQEAIALYIKRNEAYRRGHVEFIYAALARMKDFKVHRDLDSYKRVLDIFPKHKMVPTSVWQVEFQHYPKQQQCCIDILEHMESNGVIPDDAMGYQLIEIFGEEVHAFRKYRRMMYWMPKFRFANPYHVPYELPEDPTELAKIALKRMSVDLENKINVHKSTEIETSVDDTFIVSAISPTQSNLISSLPRDKAVFVEGAFTVWLRMKSLNYFMLRSACTDRYKLFHSKQQQKDDKDEAMFNWGVFEEERPSVLVPRPSLHEQEDGTILAMCITGTSSKDSLTSWIKLLEQSNPALSQVPVIFLLRSAPATDALTIQQQPSTKAVTY